MEQSEISNWFHKHDNNMKMGLLSHQIWIQQTFWDVVQQQEIGSLDVQLTNLQ